MKACARFDEILIVGYFLNGLSILDVKFANLSTFWRHLYGWDDLTPFLFCISTGGLIMIAYAKFYRIHVGYIFKWD